MTTSRATIRPTHLLLGRDRLEAHGVADRRDALSFSSTI
jgi:hypothetical protein